MPQVRTAHLKGVGAVAPTHLARKPLKPMQAVVLEQGVLVSQCPLSVLNSSPRFLGSWHSCYTISSIRYICLTRSLVASTSPTEVLPLPTAAEVRALIPASGMKTGTLLNAFKGRLPSDKQKKAFMDLVQRVTKFDTKTMMLLPKADRVASKEGPKPVSRPRPKEEPKEGPKEVPKERSGEAPKVT